jgi:hypothetical protein
MIDNIAIIKPEMTIEGANLILLKLNISGLNSFGLSLPPPVINENPINIENIETISNK